jgi:hypothetical protein
LKDDLNFWCLAAGNVVMMEVEWVTGGGGRMAGRGGCKSNKEKVNKTKQEK